MADLTWAYAGDVLRKDQANRMVYGVATGPKEDLDQQGMNPAWLRAALPKFMQRGNIRQMHSPHLAPAGKAKRMNELPDGDWAIAAKVVDDGAWKLVDEDVYTGFSIGVKNAVIGKSGQFRHGEIIGGDIIEVSLVDHPAYPGSHLTTNPQSFPVLKRAGDSAVGVQWEYGGQIEIQQHETFLAKWAHGQQPNMIRPGQLTEVQLRKMAGITEKAADDDSAKCETCKGSGKILEGNRDCPDCGGSGKMKAEKAAVEKRDFDSGVGGGVDRDKLDDSDFAGPHRSFPIVTEGDVSDAASLVGKADNPAAVKARIKEIARRKGFALPKSWESDGDSEKAATPDLTKGCGCCSDCSATCQGGCCSECTMNKSARPDIDAAWSELGQAIEALQNVPAADRRYEHLAKAATSLAEVSMTQKAAAEAQDDDHDPEDQKDGGVDEETEDEEDQPPTDAKGKSAAPDLSKGAPGAVLAQRLSELAGIDGVPHDVSAAIMTAAHASESAAWRPSLNTVPGDSGATGDMVSGKRDDIGGKTSESSGSIRFNREMINLMTGRSNPNVEFGSNVSPNVNNTESAAFDRPPTKEAAAEPDTAEFVSAIQEMITKTVAGILTSDAVLQKLASAEAARDQIVKVASATEAMGSEWQSKLAEVQAGAEDLAKAAVEKVRSDLQEEIDRIKQLPQPVKALAGAGAVAEKRFAANQGEEPRPAPRLSIGGQEQDLSDLIKRAAAGDLQAQRTLSSVFGSAGSVGVNLGEEVYKGTLTGS